MADLGNFGTKPASEIPPKQADPSSFVYVPPSTFDLSDVAGVGGEATKTDSFTGGGSAPSPELFKIKRGGVWVSIS